MPHTIQYPIWDVPIIGGGMVIAIIAIVHVTFAHFTVGAGLFTAWAEWKANRKGDTLMLKFLKDFSRYIILLPFIFGALTGVGIWFSIALVSPDATSALIHQYVWGWATEWVFFIVEIISGYIYYYTWGKLTPGRHNVIGWIYAFAAYMSLVIINGILTFMLSPGGWVVNQEFWTGFFNPTYWPSLLLRTISAMSLAGIFIAVAANTLYDYTREERHHIITEGGKFLIPLILMIPASIWFLANIPEASARMVKGGAIAMTLFFMFGLAASTLVGLYAYFGLILKRRYINLETALLLGAIAFIATGAMEFVREGVRKPYVIYDYMYSNGILVKDADRLNQEGVLTFAPWTVARLGANSPDQLTHEQLGQAVYAAQCSRCHTIDGVNGIKPLIWGWPEDSIKHNLDTLHTEQPYMPPFIGTSAEKQALADYLKGLQDQYESAKANSTRESTRS
ncbi:MAG: hypothetical protein GC154_06705 [bacterium]|nr:hypothetical protein [bacterium]